MAEHRYLFVLGIDRVDAIVREELEQRLYDVLEHFDPDTGTTWGLTLYDVPGGAATTWHGERLLGGVGKLQEPGR